MKDMTFRPNDLPKFADVGRAEVHVFIAWGWGNAIVPIGSVDCATRRIRFAAGGATQDVRIGNRYFIENVREALDAPGERFFDTAKRQLPYLPDQPQFPNLPTVAAVLDKLIVLEGDPAKGKFVEHLSFEGLRFADTTYSLTGDYYSPQDATIVMAGARHCTVRKCEYRPGERCTAIVAATDYQGRSHRHRHRPAARAFTDVCRLAANGRGRRKAVERQQVKGATTIRWYSTA
jgi:hypothetical protein